jgi:hypothetical protein
MKDHLIFDTTDAQSIIDSDSVGAFLRSSDGTLLTHTDVGGKKALDVRVAEGINVEVDLNFADDSVTAHQGTNPWVVSATNLDIRDLLYTQDSVTAYQGTSPWVVSASDLDIRDLDATQDSIESWLHDGAGTALTSTLVSGKQALDVNLVNTISINDAALANTAIANSANPLNTADTAEAIIASALANRKYLWIYNNDNTKVFIGSASVTAANGFPVSPGSYLEMRAGAAVSPYFVGQSGKTPEIRTLELS